MIYVAIMKGVYRHEIRAVGVSKESVIYLSQIALKHEFDNYHSIEVLEFSREGLVDDGKLVAEIFKDKNGLVTVSKIE